MAEESKKVTTSITTITETISTISDTIIVSETIVTNVTGELSEGQELLDVTQHEVDTTTTDVEALEEESTSV